MSLPITIWKYQLIKHPIAIASNFDTYSIVGMAGVGVGAVGAGRLLAVGQIQV